MAERFASEKNQMFPVISRETTHGKASNIRARPTQKNTSSGIKLPPCPNNRIPMLTTKPSEKVDFIRAPPAEQFVSVPSGVKFPVSPKQPVQFCTTKLSEKLYKPSPSFDLEDPYCRLMRTTYNNLHDPCLKEYYQSKIPRQRIRQQGFITSDDKKLEKQDRENSSSTNDNPKFEERKS
ncbi:fibrous sheath-interacting protein 2-like [Pelobates fuscus]|uniref:fibrous sheath-interacting protein 2-like n=1 Tax=Pelobates fuscus TaxID=191477 RepID=UPI002FE4F93B